MLVQTNLGLVKVQDTILLRWFGASFVKNALTYEISSLVNKGHHVLEKVVPLLEYMDQKFM